jgi:hypothetical protein
VLDAIGIPEGMGSLVFALSSPEASLADGNAFVLHAAAPDDRARVVVTVQAVLAPGRGEVLDDRLAALRARLRRDLETVMPFYGDHLRLAHSPNQAGAAEGVSDELAVVVPPRPLWQPIADDGAFGLSGLDYATGIKHLTLASTQILPALGLEGELITGWSAAGLASETSKKKDFLQGELSSP